MGDILKTRKTVQYYVWFNILFFVVGTLVILYVQLNYDSKFASLMEKIHNDTGYMVLFKSLGIVLGFMLLIVVGIWLFYKLIYGILLGKLSKNYKELQKIDL
jgi:TRAP-type mannitol/chloroaromatic compound transport system permease small subunit